MIKKLIGILFFAAGIAVIAAVTLRRDSFRSIAGWENLLSLPRMEKPVAEAPAPQAAAPAADEFTHPADAPAAETDSLTAASAAPEPSTAPDGSIR